MLPGSITVTARSAGRSGVTQLDMADPHQVGRLCIEFGCRQRDVYIAVAMVGDNMQEVRSYLLRIISPRPSSAIGDLPPLWASVLHADADD